MARGLEGSSHMEFYTHVVFLEISTTIVMKFKLIGAKGGISCDRLSMDRAGRGGGLVRIKEIEYGRSSSSIFCQKMDRDLNFKYRKIIWGSGSFFMLFFYFLFGG